MLEEEVYGEASPIWDPEFSQASVNNTGTTLTVSNVCSISNFMKTVVEIL